jgi:hypothetical protein
MSKTWPLFIFVSLEYCADKRLLKTSVAVYFAICQYVVTGEIINIHENSIFDSFKDENGCFSPRKWNALTLMFTVYLH